MDKEKISLYFKNFSKKECKGSSKLYEFLAIKISEDKELIELCTAAKEGQPIPNLLFAAVHYNLLKGIKHPLMFYYTNLTDKPMKIDDETFFHFKDFCMIYKDKIIELLQNKLVQTNEVGRCAYLFPIFSLIYRKINKPLSLIEIGTSAGLQLLWDKYSYSYGNEKIYGDKNSKVIIKSEIKNNNIPYLPNQTPPIKLRIGIDLHINDLRNFEDYLWLKSLIWPEHSDRLELFENAAKCFKKNPVKLIEGDGITLLENILRKVDLSTTICIFHTHVANQLPEEVKNKLVNTIEDFWEKNDIFHIYNNMRDRKLHLDYYIEGKKYTEVIGSTEGHGKWFEWNL